MRTDVVRHRAARLLVAATVALSAVVLAATGVGTGGPAAASDTSTTLEGVAGSPVLTGTPVEGTAEPGDSTPSLTSGTWVDTLGGTGDDAGVRTYYLDRTLDRSTLRVSVLLATSGTADDAMSLRLVPEDRTGTDEPCASAEASTFSSVGPYLAAGTIVGDDLSAVPAYRECLVADRLVLQVRRGTESTEGSDFATPMSITVVEEPAVESIGALPPEAGVDEPRPVATDEDARTVEASTSPTDAPLLGPGAYATALEPGEVVFVRVAVDWGQEATASLRVPRDGGREGTYGVALQLLAPDRRPVDDPATTTIFDADGEVLTQATAPVRYLDRTSYDDGVVASSLSGEYLVALSRSAVDDSADDAPVDPLPVQLGIEVGGEVEGEPAYADPFPGGTAAGDASGAGGDAGSSGPDVVAYAVGGVGALLLAASATLLVRRRRA